MCGGSLSSQYPFQLPPDQVTAGPRVKGSTCLSQVRVLQFVESHSQHFALPGEIGIRAEEGRREESREELVSWAWSAPHPPEICGQWEEERLVPVDDSLFQETHGTFNILSPLQQPLGKLKLWRLAQLCSWTFGRNNGRERQLATSQTLSQKKGPSQGMQRY